MMKKRRKMHWHSWSELSRSKLKGGMGSRDLQEFNLAMLGKQGWRLLTNPTSLCARVLKGKYFPHGDFMSARQEKNSSHTWRAILSDREALKRGLIKRVGGGRSINIWEDDWIPENIDHKPLGRLPSTTVQKVSELLLSDYGKSWVHNAVEASFFLLLMHKQYCVYH